ncbi:hypothetical protein CA233_00785 [Sphingomonas sp. ABOLD]|nr:hypothetical protein CA233_00785 [Sphingomonas sp. ABOLD]
MTMINLSVQNVTTNAGFVGGTIALQRQLSATSQFSLLQGSNAAVALDSDSLTLSAALAIGETVTALVAETDGSGASFRQIAYALNVTGAASSSDVYHLVMVRGADTKVGAGAVNMGNLLFERGFIDAPFNATSTQFTWRSGTAAHLTLPTDGRSPTPSESGKANRLNGGDYVLDFTAIGDGRTVSGTLTIQRDLGRSVPAYTFDRGARTLPAETFTARCYTASSVGELQAITASEASGATILLALGSTRLGFSTWPSYGKSPATPALIQSENLSRPTKVARVHCNNNSHWRIDSLDVSASASELIAMGNGQDQILNLQGQSNDVRVTRCRFGVPNGTAPNNFPRVSIGTDTSVGMSGGVFVAHNSFDGIAAGGVRAGVDIVVAFNTWTRWTRDSLAHGGSSYLELRGFLYEGNLVGASALDNPYIHPDTGQFQTVVAAGPGQLHTGSYKMYDNFTFGGASQTSFNGPVFTGAGSAPPRIECVIDVAGNFHSSLTFYGIGAMTNADWTNGQGMQVRGNTTVRQLTGVTGSIDGGKASGAQGFTTWDDSGTVRIPNNNQLYPGMGRTFAANAAVQVIDSYYDGVAPDGGVDVSQAMFKGRRPSSVDPVGLTPAQINDNSDRFDDPNRIVPDWSIYTLAEQYAIIRDMYATKAGGLNDRGDGRVVGAFCVRRNGAPAKRNQYGTATLSVSTAAGQVTATLSRVLGVDVICDVVRNGAATGVAITIPAGQTSAGSPVAFAAGDSILLKNDCGLLNPSVTAA